MDIVDVEMKAYIIILRRIVIRISPNKHFNKLIRNRPFIRVYPGEEWIFLNRKKVSWPRKLAQKVFMNPFLNPKNLIAQFQCSRNLPMTHCRWLKFVMVPQIALKGFMTQKLP